MHNNLIPQVHFDGGTWPLVVDADDISLESVGGRAHPGDVPVVGYCFGCDSLREVGEAQGQDGEEEHLRCCRARIGRKKRRGAWMAVVDKSE